MPRHSSYRANHSMDTGGSDWSSSQLIIGIAVAIVFGVTCFATGYVIALYDNPLEVAANTPDGSEPEAAVETPAPATTPADGAGTATTPPAATTSAAPAVTAPVPAPAPEPAKPADTIQRTGLRPTTIGALPEPGGPTPMVRTNVDLSKAPTPEIEPMDPDEATTVPGITPPVPATATATTTTPGAVPSITPPTTTSTTTPPVTAPVTTPVKVAAATPPVEKTPEKPVEKPADKPAPEVTPPVKPPVVTPPPAKPAEKDEPTVSKGSFGIQVASFDGPQRSTQAKEVQSNLKTKAQQNAEIKITADGTYHKVVITGFSTREAAKAACEKMKGKPGLEGAWVVRLSE